MFSSITEALYFCTIPAFGPGHNQVTLPQVINPPTDAAQLIFYLTSLIFYSQFEFTSRINIKKYFSDKFCQKEKPLGVGFQFLHL